MGNEIKWKKGDWCYYNFQLCQVKRVAKDGRVNEVSTGMIAMSSRDQRDSMFPQELDIKLISGEYSHFSDKLYALKGSLNYPDIARWLEEQWVITCNTRADPGAIENQYRVLADFYHQIEDEVKKLERVHVMGVKVFR